MTRTFAVFYVMSSGYVKGTSPALFNESNIRPIEATGSDALLELPDTLTHADKLTTVRNVCRERGYVGFVLASGDSITRLQQTRDLEFIADRDAKFSAFVFTRNGTAEFSPTLIAGDAETTRFARAVRDSKDQVVIQVSPTAVRSTIEEAISVLQCLAPTRGDLPE